MFWEVPWENRNEICDRKLTLKIEEGLLLCISHYYWYSLFTNKQINQISNRILDTDSPLPSNATACPLRLRGPPPPGLWLKCNRLLSLGRPVGAVTLSRWEWWWNERWIWGARGRGALNLISTNYPDHGHHGRLLLSRKNAYGRAGNRTRDLMVVVRSSDNQATRLVLDTDILLKMFPRTAVAKMWFPYNEGSVDTCTFL